MRCERFHFEIALWVEGDLGNWRARRLERHLSLCANCRAYAESFRRHQAAVKQIAAQPLEEAGLAEAVMARVQTGTARSRRSRFVTYRAAAVAAGLALVGVLAWFQYDWERPPDSAQRITATLPGPASTPALPHPAASPIRKPVMVKLLTDDPNVVFVMLSD